MDEHNNLPTSPNERCLITTVTKRFTFEATHRLPFHQGKCSNWHGHSYKMFVTIGGPIIPVGGSDPASGMVMDFSQLKEAVNGIVDKLDHANLNDYFETPTAEIMAQHIFRQLCEKLPESVRLMRIRLWETEDSYCEVSDIIIPPWTEVEVF